MLNLLSRKTLPVIFTLMKKGRFSQTELSLESGVSIGRVNSIVKWLNERGFVEKVKKGYELVKPNALSELFASSYFITKKRSYDVSLTKEEAKNLIKSKKGILCLESAGEEIGSFEDVGSVFALYNPEVALAFDNVERGSLNVHFYEHGLFEVDTDGNLTSVLQTYLDLVSLNKDSGNISSKLWRTKQ